MRKALREQVHLHNTSIKKNSSYLFFFACFFERLSFETGIVHVDSPVAVST